MSDQKSPIINLPNLPDSVDNAVKNLTDKPTEAIGKTLADAWFLVFGGISQIATKRQMKYAHELDLYNQELNQAISKIPDSNRCEPDIQIAAQALENSKYCIESNELRKLFVNLISKSMDSDYAKISHPSFAEIIKQMSPIDALILQTMNPKDNFPLVDYVIEDQRTDSYEVILSNVYITSLPNINIENSRSAISSLHRLGIIEIDTQSYIMNESVYIPYKETDYYKNLSSDTIRRYPSKRSGVHEYSGHITPLGQNFFEVCVK